MERSADFRNSKLNPITKPCNHSLENSSGIENNTNNNSFYILMDIIYLIKFNN